MDDLKAQAALLKGEGNTYFAAKEFVDAEAKFTEALALDDKNAILYSNRAACRLQLGKWVGLLLLQEKRL